MTRDQPTRNKRTIQKLFASFNGDELPSLDTLVAESYTGPQGDKGPAGFRTTIGALRAAFPDLHYTLDDLVAENDEVAVRWHWTGTHKAPFRGHPATGKVVTNNGLGIFHLRDDKVVTAVLETDRLGFLQQIGVVPENPGLAPRAVPGPR